VSDPGFCIKLPGGYTQGKTDTANPAEPGLDFENAENVMKGFRVRYKDAKLSEIDSTYTSYVDPSTNEVKGKGELLGGKGKWFYSKTKGGPGSTIGVYVEGPKKLFICESASSADGPDQQAKLDICKTIVPLAS
jgi:hypothetical protein